MEMFNPVYESLTLHHICDTVAGWHARVVWDDAPGARECELYWLERLAEFLYAIRPVR